MKLLRHRQIVFFFKCQYFEVNKILMELREDHYWIVTVWAIYDRF